MVITSKPLGGCGYKVFERQQLQCTSISFKMRAVNI
jgi:hypothetical protein